MTGIQTMRNLLAVCAVLVLALGIVSGNLWRELRAERQQLAKVQDQLTQAQISLARLGQERAPQAAIQAQAVPTGAAQTPEPRQDLPLMPPRPVAPKPVVSATASRPLRAGSEQERRTDALMQSDRAATARAQAWNTAFRGANALTPEQLQALNAAAIAELQRETEESLQIDSRTGSAPMDAKAAAQLKVETVTRQNETNLRILERMTPQLTAAQSDILRGMFEGWVRAKLPPARAELERVASQGN